MTTITKDVGAYVKQVKAQIVDSLKSAQVQPGSEAAGTQILQLARTAVDAFVAKNGNIPPAVARALLEKALGEVQKEVQSDIADLIAREGGPRTLLKKAGEIRENVDKSLAKANPALFDQMRIENADRAELSKVLGTVSPLASVCGGPDGHDYLWANRIETTAQGAADMSASQRQAQGELPIETRQTQLPFAELRELGVDSLMLKALSESAQGVDGVFQALALKDEIASLPKDDKGFQSGVKGLPGGYGGGFSFDASPRTLALLERTEHQLRTIQEIADRDTSPDGALIKEALAKPELALAKAVLMGAQVMYVKTDMGREQPRLQNPKHFDQLSGHRAARNLPIAVAAIEGAKLATRIVSDVIDKGLSYYSQMPGEDAFYMQRMLEATARWAMQSKDPQQMNEIHGRAVALESSLSLVTTLGLYGDDARKVLPNVMQVMNDVALASGDHFIRPDGKKASASSLVAMERAGALLKALHPGKNPAWSDADWQKHALDVTQRASVQDVASVVTQRFGREELPKDGAELRQIMGERFKADEWFIGRVTGQDAADPSKSVRQFPIAEELRAEGKKPLDAEEQKDLAALLFACNAGWKQGQVFRGGDRVDSTVREGVYDAYENLVRARGDAVQALYVVLKDAWEALEKGEMVAKG
jgi:DNA-binding phage protein